jgi:hypothetical protein
MGSKSIGKRITIAEHSEATTVIIDAKISKTQQLSLEMWFGGWVGLGCLIAYGAYTFSGNESTVYLICLAFWGFFFVRIAKVIAWRRIGREIIRVSHKQLLIKNAFNKRGKDKFYSINELSEFKASKSNPTSFMQGLDNSFWIIGGDTIGFAFKGKKHVLGKQLKDSDALQLANYLNKSVARYSKKN